jgi:exodeoxyribonuclease (lambda-induced)
MIYIECEQGTEEWHAARCGVITASRFKDACDRTKKGEPSAKLVGYAAEVALERVTGQAADAGFVTWQMKRGTELEPLARMAYEANTGHMATEAGVVLTDDRLFGYSTDGFIERDGLIEIKCPASPEKIIDMWREGDLSEYIHQIQGGLWITGRLWADFIMYCPALACVGKDLFVKRVERNEAFIEKLEADLMAFAAMVKDNEDVLRQEAA